jgi:endonuclease/exonuclease/phosphatase family metal-dependent hydrolase
LPAHRIDYIFVLSSRESTVQLRMLASDVVLNVPGAPLSDHCGVLTRIEITPAPVSHVGVR